MAIVAKFDWLRLLREENWDEFNALAKVTPPQLTNADLRMADLRQASLVRADLRGAYLRNADLRGVDLSEAHLHGTSIHEARISGVFFPENLAPEEISLSVSMGTRMRTVPADRLPP